MVGSTPHCKRRSSASSGDQRGPLEFMNLSLSGHQSSLESLGTKNRAGHTACRGKPQPARNGHDHGRASCSQTAAKHTCRPSAQRRPLHGAILASYHTQVLCPERILTVRPEAYSIHTCSTRPAVKAGPQDQGRI
ncbi:hypothetical protein AcV5_001340 [Taiwanofungus camphoratus]|nr:hypothetical protein AcV5_001340 [Antrodia cinnamomea]